MGKRRLIHKVLTKNSDTKRALGKPRHRWKDNIKWIFKKLVLKAWSEFV
jgi:hypothetical protein